MSCTVLKLNMNKTQLLVCVKARFLTAFQPRIQSLKSSIHLDSDPASCVKLLGVFTEKTLSFNRIINETCTIGFYKLTKLRNLRSFLEVRNTILLVKCFIAYCNIFIIAILYMQIYHCILFIN